MLAVLSGILLLAGLYVSTGRASDEVLPDTSFASRAESLLATYHELGQFNGAVLVAEHGKVIYRGAFGPAVVEFDVDNSVETRFRIASISKTMTAVVVLQLVAESRIDLDVPIGAYIDTARADILECVTVRQLLTHTSGLEREYLPKDSDPTVDYTVAQLIENINLNTKLAAEPYRNAGFVLLAAVVENVTGNRYQDVLYKRIFEPLEMDSTVCELGITEPMLKMARGYRLRHGVYACADIVNMSCVRGNGGVVSTVDDLYRFEQALRDGSLLDEAMHELMFTVGNGEWERAMPWAVDMNPDDYPEDIGRVARHRGANQGGFRSQLTMQLDDDRVVILLANLDISPRYEITIKLFELMMNGETTPPVPDPADRVMSQLNTAGFDSAAQLLLDQRNDDEQTASLVVNDVYSFGHHLIRAGQAGRALEIFLLCDRVFPDTDTIVTSIAFAHLSMGNREEARVEAERALQINESNPEAKGIILDATAHH